MRSRQTTKRRSTGWRDELSSLAEKLRSTRTAAKEKALFITDHYEVYIGKEYMMPEKLAALADIVRAVRHQYQ